MMKKKFKNHKKKKKPAHQKTPNIQPRLEENVAAYIIDKELILITYKELL